MTPYADALARRAALNEWQLQILLGTLLGAGRLVAGPGGFRLALRLQGRHAWLAQWTYERLAPLLAPPIRRGGRVELHSVAHPIFAQVAALLASKRVLRGRIGPPSLWLWATYQRIGVCEQENLERCDCAAVALPGPAATLWSSVVRRGRQGAPVGEGAWVRVQSAAAAEILRAVERQDRGAMSRPARRVGRGLRRPRLTVERGSGW